MPVVGSATVGPDAMIAGSSPGTSEIASVATPRGGCRGGKPPALDRRKVLADAVDLVDRRAAGEQRPGQRLLLLEADTGRRLREQGRATAGCKTDHKVVRAKPGGQRESPVGGGNRGFVRNRVAGLDDLDSPARRTVAIAGYGEASERGGPVRLERARHLGRRLAEAQHHGAPIGRWREMRRQHMRGRNRGERGIEQGFQRLSRIHRHRRLISEAGQRPKTGHDTKLTDWLARTFAYSVAPPNDTRPAAC